MRVPLSWLREFVDIPPTVSAEELAEKLTIAGLEVAKVEYLGLPQSAERHGVPPSYHLVWNPEKIVLGYIREVKAHPKADRLVLAVVDYGASQPETVVTGAPNLFPYRDQGELNPPILSPLALEGAEVIDGHGDGVQRMILQEKDLRGIPNRCMVCSEMELGISEEHEGVILLDYAEFKQFPAGTPFADVLGDIVLDIEITPNMARCLNIFGIAREVATLLKLELRAPDYTLPPAVGTPVDEMAAIEIYEPELNPRFTAALLHGVKIEPSPAWMQRRLRLVGQRPINNIVDISNYVMFEIGQPTHAFDYDILKGRAGSAKPTIITRLPEADETLTTLDGKAHRLEAHNLLVADLHGALSVAGVMGGLESEVQEPDAEKGLSGSQTILMEAAAWNFISIRKTINNLKIHSEAATRFSRGVHPAMARRGLIRTVQLVVEITGAKLAPGVLDVYPLPTPTVVVELSYRRVTDLLGFEVPYDEMLALLRGLEFGVEEAGQGLLRITVPDHRLDISADPVIGEADLVEEIARIYGYNRIPDQTMADELPPQRGNPDLDREEYVRDLLAQAGLREVINYRFTTPEKEGLLTPFGLTTAVATAPYVEIANPISVERTALRQTLLASLLENASRNINHHTRQQLFEIGSVYLGNANGDLPEEPRHLAILITGLREIDGWMGGASTAPVDFFDLKGIVEILLHGLHITRDAVAFGRSSHVSFHPGRAAELTVDGEVLGVLGEVHPKVCEAFGLGINLDVPVLAAEINLDRLLAHTQRDHRIIPIPTQPPAYRDLAVVVKQDRPAAEIETLMWQSGTALLREVRLFDVYQGDPIPAGHKSLAYTLTFRSETETLTDKTVNTIQKEIIKTLENNGAQIRA